MEILVQVLCDADSATKHRGPAIYRETFTIRDAQEAYEQYGDR